jgi:hypothetical protein
MLSLCLPATPVAVKWQILLWKYAQEAFLCVIKNVIHVVSYGINDILVTGRILFSDRGAAEESGNVGQSSSRLFFERETALSNLSVISKTAPFDTELFGCHILER